LLHNPLSGILVGTDYSLIYLSFELVKLALCRFDHILYGIFLLLANFPDGLLLLGEFTF
jgi:hypothetical protein